jgi:hypothetical protein
VRLLNESNPKEIELQIRRLQIEDSNAVIHQVQIKPLVESRFSIPLCRLQCFLLVRPISKVHFARLQNEFVMDYRDGAVPCMSFPTTTLIRCFMFLTTFGPPEVHYSRRPVMSLIPCLKMIMISLTLLARCFSCGTEIID